MPTLNILIVCWEFPLNRAIGGRRWAKMAKSFLKCGANIFVINKHAEQAHLDPIWISKEFYSKMKVYSLKESVYVKWLNDYSSPLRAFKIRFAKLILSCLSKGTIYDKAIGIEQQFLSMSSRIIQENNIDLICVTGAPFNLLYYTSKLKKKFPYVKIVADYRDPWIKAQNYGMRGLSSKRRSMEYEKQNHVLETVDHVTAPNNFLLNEIEKTYTGDSAKAKFMELPHAFDPDDVLASTVNDSDKVSIIYAGALYIGCEPYLELLNESVNYLKKNTNIRFEINIYTDDLVKGEVFEAHKNNVHVLPSIQSKIFEKIASSDYVIILLSEHNKNYVTSKFYEFLPYRKPFLYLGPKGFVRDKILSERLGFSIDKKEDLKNILFSASIKESIKTDISTYTFDNTADRFLSTVMN